MIKKNIKSKISKDPILLAKKNIKTGILLKNTKESNKKIIVSPSEKNQNNDCFIIDSINESDLKDHIENPNDELKDIDTMNVPWIEKYRPINVNDLVLDESTKNKIKKIIENKNMPNLIISGVPGIGKTSTILCLAKNLLGKYFNEAVLEMNASDERGIRAVHESIEYFCKKKINISENFAQHKIVLLDEADNMTSKAQQLINNLIKNYHDTTRFAFTCNEPSDIIEAIQSRCIMLKFKRLNNEQVSAKLLYICKNEKMNFTTDGIKSIVAISQGDLRKAINILQLTYNGYDLITPDNVYKLCDKPHPEIIRKIFEYSINKNIKLALNELNILRNKGYSSSDIALSMINLLKDENYNLFPNNEQTRIKFFELTSQVCLNISKGLNTPIQLTGLMADFYLL